MFRIRDRRSEGEAFNEGQITMGLVQWATKFSFIPKVVRSHKRFLSRVTEWQLHDQISNCWMVTCKIYPVFHPQGNPITNLNKDFPLGKKGSFLGAFGKEQRMKWFHPSPHWYYQVPILKTVENEKMLKGEREGKAKWHLLSIRCQSMYQCFVYIIISNFKIIWGR